MFLLLPKMETYAELLFIYAIFLFPTFFIFMNSLNTDFHYGVSLVYKQ